MHILQKVMLCVLSASLLFSALVFPSAAEEDSVPTLSAHSAVLIEAESGRVIYSKRADFPLPMASTTKLMTALTALSLASPDHIITVSPEAIGVEGSSVYLTAGEELTLEELLYALLLSSANDAAAAIAIGLLGSIEDFAAEMNRMADTLGLVSTSFQNPHGLDDKHHFTTAYELALISRAVLKNDLLATIVSTQKATIPHPEYASGRLLVNHNKLLRRYDGCIGMKTGYTQKSGRCLVSAAERDGVTLIAVTLNAPDDWSDHTHLLDYGFSCYESRTLAKRGDVSYPLHLCGCEEESVLLKNRETLTVSLPKSAPSVRTVIHARQFELAPIQKGHTYAYIYFYCDTDRDGSEELIASLPLISDTDIAAMPKKSFWGNLKSLFPE